MNSLLDNMEIIRWCYEGITENTLIDTSSNKILKSFNKQEKKWGNDILKKYYKYPSNKNIVQWTTKLGEELVKEAMVKLKRENVKNGETIKSSSDRKTYRPDVQCDKYIYEVKARNWTTPGTAGEKILGVPLKYSEIPTLTNKKVKIVLIGYQEFEAKYHFAVGNICDPEKCNVVGKQILKYFEQIGFEYIPFTDILNQLGYKDGCWL